MAQLDQVFNAEEIPEDDRSFDLLPAGDYEMQVIESEIKDTDLGQQLVLTLEVLSGPSQGRRVWDRLNIVNQNADAQRISQRALADLCLATGVKALKDTEELHFKPFIGKVTITKPNAKSIAKGYTNDKNSVRYKAKGAAAVHMATAGNPSTARQTHNGGSAAAKPAARPWANRAAG